MLNAGGWLLVVVLFVIGGLTLTTLGLHFTHMDLPNAGEYTMHLILFVCEKLQVGDKERRTESDKLYKKKLCTYTTIFVCFACITYNLYTRYICRRHPKMRQTD